MDPERARCFDLEMDEETGIDSLKPITNEGLKSQAKGDSLAKTGAKAGASLLLGPAGGYLVDIIARASGRNTAEFEEAHKEIIEEMVFDSHERIRRAEAELERQGEKVRRLDEHQAILRTSAFIEAALRTDSPEKLEALKNLHARFADASEDYSQLTYWWNSLVEMDPGIWGLIEQLGRDGASAAVKLEGPWTHLVRDERAKPWIGIGTGRNRSLTSKAVEIYRLTRPRVANLATTSE